MNEAVQPAVASGGEGDGQLLQLLDQASQSLSGFRPDYNDALADLNELRSRIQSGTFRLAVLGQFKRGKSTLLNALLGLELLPTDILPVTAIPTYIKGADTPCAVVYFNSAQHEAKFFDASVDGSLGEFLSKYVTESGNPHNQLGVARVEVGYPSPLLQQGVVLVDTPGIGSTHKHNTEVAYEVLPHCDAALFVVSPEPPITEAELSYLRDIREQLPRTFFLLNKVDILDDRERVSSLNFLADQLTPLCQVAPHIIPISARKGLQARVQGDSSGWAKSGMYEVERSLIEFFSAEKKQVLRESLQRRLQTQLHNVQLRLQLSLNALRLPEDELNSKITQFRNALPAIEREKQAADDVLGGDHDRAVVVLNRKINQVRSLAKEKILQPVEAYLESIDDTEELERQCRQVLAEKIPVVFTPAMRVTVEEIHKEAIKLLILHQQRCDELIEKVRKTAAELFAIPYHAPQAGEAIVNFDIPGWSSDLFISDMDPLGQKLSRKFFTKKYRHKKTVERLRQEALKLIGLNVEQISWALRKGLDESFRKYRVHLNDELDKTIHATRQAMEMALSRNEELSSKSSPLEVELSKSLNTIEVLLNEGMVGLSD